jgi:membrane-associated phospholipid phosphatase
MMPVRLKSVPWAVALLLGGGALAAQAQAQAHAPLGALAAAQSAPQSTPSLAPIESERLSAWLLRTHGPQADTTALHWRSANERLPQQHLRQAVVAAFESAPSSPAMPDAQRQLLADWVARLPLTGRLTLASHDPRALQAMPESDPVHRRDDEFVLFARPRLVAVLSESGLPCLLPHVPGALARDYVRSCAGLLPRAHEADWVWVAQPDGRVQTFGVSHWNQSAQVPPAPGAWIWAPSRSAGFAHEWSDNMVRLLATQAPPDAHPMLAGLPVQTAPEPMPERPEPAAAVFTSNDWGELGFWQTPSARFAGAGSLRSTFSNARPYVRGTFMLQPLDWFEFGFRYTDILNRSYGPLAGGQSLKDKSVDIKLRLREEDAYGPAVALGLRDLGGTGLFASEYLVASRRWGNWDASIGIGWGNLGTRGNVSNPMRLFGDRFDRRAGPETGMGGEANIDQIFTGPAALFGGVQWASPTSPWVFKAEVDGNSFQLEPKDNRQVVDSPINFGVVYRHSPGVHWSVSWQRGNRLAFGLTLQGRMDQLRVPKTLDPALPALRLQAPAALPASGWSDLVHAVERHTSWQVLALRRNAGTLQLEVEIDAAMYLQQRIDRAVQVLHAHAPADVGVFQIELRRHGLALSQVEVERAEWLLQQSTAMPSALALPTQSYTPALPGLRPEAEWQSARGPLSLSWSPTYSQIIGGPDGFILYQLGLAGSAQWQLNPNTRISGVASLRLLDNYDRFNFRGISEMERVRTHLREYVVTSRFNIPRLDINHSRHLGGNHFASVYAGLFEPMFGGVGAEWLYRPFGRSWAFGVDVNYVRQRGFRQDFEFREHSVLTGHATLHWDTGWNDVQAKIMAGRYLAGDKGVTLDFSRTFRNGTTFGAWATFTNVPFEVFGEGSFDKGIYVRIPFEAMLPLSVPGVADLRWTPLTRDGGARLQRSDTLAELTSARSGRALFWRSAEPAQRRSAEGTAHVLYAPDSMPLADPTRFAAPLVEQVGQIPASSWLWAGGAVLASGLLDRSADRWAARNPDGHWQRLGDVGSAAPLVLAAGSALLSSGVAGPAAAQSAQTALLAGAYTLGASVAVRTLTGRSRPLQGQGSSHFTGPSRGSYASGFTSNHTALAFALVTPFAQQHNMPWLYGVAAATALGRVQQREHWLSDTVGGALLGYGIASLLLMQQEQDERSPRIRVTPQSVHADWRF